MTVTVICSFDAKPGTWLGLMLLHRLLHQLFDQSIILKQLDGVSSQQWYSCRRSTRLMQSFQTGCSVTQDEVIMCNVQDIGMLEGWSLISLILAAVASLEWFPLSEPPGLTLASVST